MNVPKTCKTCAHRQGVMGFTKCMRSGFFIETERKFPDRCGVNFEGWAQRLSIFESLKIFWVGVSK